MNNYDKGLGELLKLLNAHPELIKELVFYPTRVTELLNSEEARQLALGQEATAFLSYVAGPTDGYPVTQCLQGTSVLCAKGTGVSLKCGSRTKL
jgi:hypothetical protein